MEEKFSHEQVFELQSVKQAMAEMWPNDWQSMTPDMVEATVKAISDRVSQLVGVPLHIQKKVLDHMRGKSRLNTRFTMRRPPLGKYSDPSGDSSKEGTPFLHQIVNEYGQMVAWISRVAGDRWQIQRFKNGRPGDGTGDYETAEEALAVLQKEF